MGKKPRIVHPYIFVGIHYQEIMKNRKEESPRVEPRKKITLKQVLQIVANECEISIEDILSKSRKQAVVDARYICFAALKLRFGLSLHEIGINVANRDHTTVIHGLRNFHDRYTIERHYRDMADRIFKEIEIEYDGNKLTSAI